jgi:hypothetical protein
VSPTAVAALLLISESRPVLEVVAKLTAREFKQMVDIVRQRLDAVGRLARTATVLNRNKNKC